VSRGKGGCSWIWGTIKKLVRKASLQNPYEEQITTPKQYYERTVVKIILVIFVDCAVEDYGKEMVVNKERFNLALLI
jgi:hypothetical protein